MTGNTGTPSYVWYKQGETDPVYTDPANGVTSEYTVSDAQFENDGFYYCDVSMTVGDFVNDAFSSDPAELVARGKKFKIEISFSFDTPGLHCL